jgi:hypothetical protein
MRVHAQLAEDDHMARRTPLLILILVALFAVGCGGEDSDPRAAGKEAKAAQAGVPDPQQTTREFVAEAKRICAGMERRLPTMNPAKPPTAKQLRTLLDVWRDTVAQLRSLDPPAGERARFSRMLTHFETAIRRAWALPDADGETSLVLVASMADEGQKGGAIAYDYGLETCSLFPPAPSPEEFERYILEQAKKEQGLFAPPPTKLKLEKAP